MKLPADQSTTRRDAIKLGLIAGAGLAMGRVPAAHAAPSIDTAQIMTRPIPKTGEMLPVVGIGTNNFGAQSEEEIAPRRETLRALIANGGSVIDTARGYGRGRAEEVIGQIVRELNARDRVFIATKIGTPPSREEGIQQLEACLRALGVDRVSALRAHAVNGGPLLFPILREWKAAGRTKYFGVTTVSDSQYPELEKQIREENLDIIEIDYSVVNRNAAERILPLAKDNGVAVMTAVPFGGRRGSVLPGLADKPLPAFAGEMGVTSWAQLCLKYILANPAVTVAIPGTTNARHIVDNLGAGRGELPDANMLRRIEQIFDAL
jgi:aryl-alcohol dehydrogenase-like predicted oxidoreductase